MTRLQESNNKNTLRTGILEAAQTLIDPTCMVCHSTTVRKSRLSGVPSSEQGTVEESDESEGWPF